MQSSTLSIAYQAQFDISGEESIFSGINSSPSSSNIYTNFSTFMTPSERLLVGELCNIPQSFSNITQWDHCIFSTRDSIAAISLNPTSLYRIDNSNVSITSETLADVQNSWSKVGEAFYKSMLEKSSIAVAANNSLLQSNTQLAYLDVLKELCINNLVTKGYTQYNNNTFDPLITTLSNSVSIQQDDAGDNFKTLTTYLGDCKKQIIGYTGLVQDDIKAFLGCFIPFLVATYIVGFIKTVDKTSSLNDTKPTGFIPQIVAIFIFRLYLIQTSLVLVQVTPPTKPSGRSALFNVANYEIDLMLKMLQTDLSNNSSYIGDIAVMLAQNRSKGESLDEITQRIVMAKANLDKAVANDQIINPSVKQSNIVKWIWIGTFIFTFLLLLGGMFLVRFALSRQYPNVDRYFMAYSMIICVTTIIVFCFLFARMMFAT